jgi:hypothetical protein
MTVEELFTLLANKVETASEDIFSAVNAVSAALMQLATSKKLSIAKGSTLLNTVANQPDVLLPPDCRTPDGVPKIGSLDLHVMPAGGEAVYATPAKPSFYRIEGRRLVLAPTPDAVYQLFLSYYAHAEKVVELDDELPFGGLLDDAFPGLVMMVMLKGRMVLVTQEAQAQLALALQPLVLAEEQAVADSMNNYA